MVMFQAMGVSLLFVMGLFPSIWTVGWLIMPVYILRTICNNCCYAIIRSLLMDYVPKVCAEGAVAQGFADLAARHEVRAGLLWRRSARAPSARLCCQRGRSGLRVAYSIPSMPVSNNADT